MTEISTYNQSFVDGRSKIDSVYNYTVDKSSVLNYPCIFKKNDITLLLPNNSLEAWILNPPCYLSQGNGLYGMVTGENDNTDWKLKYLK